MTSGAMVASASLGAIAMLGYATAQREIDQAEQDLWTLTSAPRPGAGGVEAKLTEIARPTTQQRMNYIRTHSRCSPWHQRPLEPGRHR
jgi:hypothetical protein